jgi:CHAD domain-containing protein
MPEDDVLTILRRSPFIYAFVTIVTSPMTRAGRPFVPFQKQLEALRKAAKHIHDGDVEAVHRARVASRRLRELVPILGLDSAAAPKLNRRLRKVTKLLGAVRELDVLAMMIEDLGRDTRYSQYALTALKQVGDAVQRDRTAARDHLATKLPLAKIQRLTRHLRRAVRQETVDHERGHERRAPSKPAWVWAVEARTARRAMGVRSAIASAGTVYIPERLHDVRIAVKKLRYAMELAAEARSQRGNGDIGALGALKAAQDLLGRLHDVEVLIGRSRQEQASLSPPTLTAWRELDSLIRRLEDDCRALHAEYMHHRARLIAVTDRVCGMKEHTVRRRAVGAS